MKKLTAILTALTMTAASMLTVSAETTYALGDVDMDGTITGRDAMIVSKYADGVLDIELTEEQLVLADVNEDGTADNSDAALIYEQQKYRLGDVDRDGYVAMTDYMLIMVMCRTEYGEPVTYGDHSVDDEAGWILADVTGNGVVNCLDFYCVQNMYIQKAAMLPHLVEDRYYAPYGVIEAFTDLNEDFQFTLDDAAVILRSYGRYYACMASAISPIYDIDKNGTVEIKDAQIVLDTYAQLAVDIEIDWEEMAK